MSDAARVRAAYEAKARAELAAADALVEGAERVASHGDLFAEVMLVKGAPGPDDLAAARVLAGADGEAATKALAALGIDTGRLFATCSRPSGRSERTADRLRLQAEAIGPRRIVALDAEAAEDLGAAFGVTLRAGEPQRVHGRLLLAVDGLEASLADEDRKRRVWEQLRALRVE